uniref:LysR family transcriptional regulator n=1 Tax=Pararhizobium sp. IMCC3301 TaxID=3067904 RepID=UPI0027410110|nr:LysR family transcriptional regulator [Pararhizobium sp. IMCC3301]
MELRDLHSLIGIAETGSLSGAARKLNLTQPALSASLKRLEQELNVLLVRRHSRGAALTEEGKYVLQKSYHIVRDVAEVVSVVDGLAEEPIGLVRLGLPTTIAGGLIPEFFPMLRSRYPQIRLNIIEAMSGRLAELLQLGDIDLALLFDIQPMSGLRSEPILKEKLCLLVPSDHPMANKPGVRLDEITQLNLVLPSSANSIRKHINAACEAEGLSLNVVADIDSFPGLVSLVKGGHCTILPTYLAMQQAHQGKIVALDIMRPNLEWTIHLASRHDATRPRASLVTGQLLTQACKTLVQDGIWPGEIINRA